MSNLTLEQMQSLPEEEAKKLFSKLDKLRHQAKTVNYSALYNAGAETLSQNMQISKAHAKKILDAYWKRNFSVKKVADNQDIKTITKENCRVNGNWLWNPISKSYYSLRNKKDVFSTLNQGTGAYIFDLWLSKIIAKTNTITGQFHDSAVIMVKENNREKVKKILEDAMNEVNDELKLNAKLGVDFKFGKDYGFEK